MHDRAVPYRYPLAAKLRQDAWERDTLALELQRAQVLLEEAQLQLEGCTARVAAAELRMRELHRHDCSIVPEASRMLQLYLQGEYAAQARQRARARQAEQLLEQVAAQLAAKRVEVRTLERHCERGRQAHDVVELRRLQAAADESWLVHERGGKA